MSLLCAMVGHNWRYMRCQRCGSWRHLPAKQVPASLKPPTVHQLKCWPAYFQAVASGAKPFEVRRMDRDYQVGHLLLLCEWDPMEQRYSTRRCTVQVTYLLQGPGFGIEAGYAVLGVQVVR
jgi:hypothetical protein